MRMGRDACVMSSIMVLQYQVTVVQSIYFAHVLGKVVRILHLVQLQIYAHVYHENTACIMAYLTHTNQLRGFEIRCCHKYTIYYILCDNYFSDGRYTVRY